MSDKIIIPKIVSIIQDKLDANFTLLQLEKVAGGDINNTWTLRGKSTSYFLKINQGKPDDFFEKEKSGLESLISAHHSLHIPKPLLTGKEGNALFLLMEHLEFEDPKLGFFEKLGKGLAQLHRNTASLFGYTENNYLGSQPQDNTQTIDWPTFYAERRILPQAKRALDNGYLNSTDIIAIEKLCQKFSDIFPEEPPALLHGDLWNGNYACLKNQAASIFDPAVYYGNREIDIAMTLLFGGFDRSFYQSYNENFPLQKGWQDRIDICQLYPLLMHLNHFGMDYYSRVKNIIQ